MPSQYFDRPTPTIGETIQALPAGGTILNVFPANPSPTDTIYFQIHTTAAQPTAGAVPLYWLPLRPLDVPNFNAPGLAAGAAVGRRLINFGFWFSATPDTYTAGPVGSFWAVVNLP